MEDLVSVLRPTASFWKGKRVLVTGHTGFKGGWLSRWLHALGAEVHGYALAPDTVPSFFAVAAVEPAMASSTIADIRDLTALCTAFEQARPEIVFHLAAQALVRRSYAEPVDTYAVNVMGVVHLLEAARLTRSAKAVITVTSDKCYENREWPWPYREHEAMGGHDPYSSSKGCAELVTAAYRRSFLAEAGVGVATARAGNVIGGGDWSADRLLPDVLRAHDAGRTVVIRSPGAIRPWQHVLEPLAGYLLLAERLYADNQAFGEAWNFGPADEDALSVGAILDYIVAREPGVTWTHESARQPHEASLLRVDSSKARARLGWTPRWHLTQALDRTLAWHRAWREGQDMAAVTRAQIDDYMDGASGVDLGAH